MSVDEIREQIGAIAREPRPGRWERFMAHGYFLGGSVGARDFHLDYHYNAPKNPQTYSVRGFVSDGPDWRIVRLKLRAHDPWVSGWILGAILAMLALYMASEGLSAKGAFVLLVFVLGVLALANLLYIPDVVVTRVSSLIASELRGSVRAGEHWVVSNPE